MERAALETARVLDILPGKLDGGRSLLQATKEALRSRYVNTALERGLDANFQLSRACADRGSAFCNFGVWSKHDGSSYTSQVSAPGASSIVPSDTTSILKKLTKDVEIGSTVDPKNGDTGPRAISLVRSTFGLKKGQLLVCNFDDSAGTAGKGTTIEVLNPKPHSKPPTFTQSTKLEGCDGDAATAGNQVYGAGLVSDVVSQFTQIGDLKKSYGSPIQAPFADADAFCGEAYAPEDIYVSDSKTGAIIKLAFLPVRSGKVRVIQVISGFAVNKGSGWSILGPSGIQYNSHKNRQSLQRHTLYRGRGR